MIRTSSIWSALIFLLVSVPHASATEIEPRAYINTPVGINFLLLGYAYTDGGLATQASSPVKDAELTMHTGVLAYARSLDLWGKSGKFDLILPYSKLSGHALAAGEKRERRVSGLNDPLVRLSINFYGAPALSLEEFADYQQDLTIGASVQVGVPLGQYDEDRLVNLGNNRWSVKSNLGLSKAFGPLTLELSGGATFFTDNDEYFGGLKLGQDPLYTTQLHATYNYGRSIWAAASWTYDYGGRTTIDGVRSDDREENSRIGVTLALPVDRNNSLKFFTSSSLKTTTGRDFDLYGLAWQYRWGAGL